MIQRVNEFNAPNHSAKGSPSTGCEQDTSFPYSNSKVHKKEIL